MEHEHHKTSDKAQDTKHFVLLTFTGMYKKKVTSERIGPAWSIFLKVTSVSSAFNPSVTDHGQCSGSRSWGGYLAHEYLSGSFLLLV